MSVWLYAGNTVCKYGCMLVVWYVSTTAVHNLCSGCGQLTIMMNQLLTTIRVNRVTRKEREKERKRNQEGEEGGGRGTEEQKERGREEGESDTWRYGVTVSSGTSSLHCAMYHSSSGGCQSC